MKKWTLFFFIFCMTLSPSIAAGTEVVISFDGMRQDFSEDYMKNGRLPHFKTVTEKGMYAKNIQTIFPSLTSASHAAIATGANPSKSGLVSNEIHPSNKKLTDRDSAFFFPLDAEPIWFKARKKGKTTATVLFPGSNPTMGKKADYAIYYGETLAESTLVPLDFKKKKTAFLTLPLDKNKDRKVYISAVDSNTFDFSLDPQMNSKETVHLDEWGSLSFLTDDGEAAGFSFKLKSSKPDLSEAKLYRTAVTTAAVEGPSSFKKEIYQRFGHFPVQDDDLALAKKWITRREYEEISERFAQWTTDVSLFIKKRYEPDLLFFYYPQIDHESHKYLLVDPRQPGYSKEKSKRYMDHVYWSYQLADKMLGQILPYITEKDRILLVSDHGMEPVHSRLSPNELLKREGFLVRDKDGKVNVKRTKAYAVASGSIAHVYINLQGREKGGIVDQEHYTATRRDIAKIFTNEKAEKKLLPRKYYFLYGSAEWWNKLIQEKGNMSGSIEALKDAAQLAGGQKINPYEEVLLPGNRQAGNINHENAGDILLAAKKGYYMAQDDNKEVQVADELGNHGGDPSRPELYPIFIAAGYGIPKGIIESDISTLDIAPTLYELLDIRQPDFVEGKPIRELTTGR